MGHIADFRQRQDDAISVSEFYEKFIQTEENRGKDRGHLSYLSVTAFIIPKTIALHYI